MKTLLLLFFVINSARSTPCSNCSTQPASCPTNFITLHPGASSLDDCVCPGGYFVVNSTCSACPGGFMCPGNSTTLPIPCASGTFCPPQSNTSTPCPAGFVCGMTASSPMPCDVGFYCPENTKHQLPCPPGMLCNGSIALCAFGGVVPNCTQCVNCTCCVGSVAYNNTCYNLTHGCPLNLDCARRDAAGSAPCVEGYEMSAGVCVLKSAAAPFVLSPPVIAAIVAGALVLGGGVSVAVSAAVGSATTTAVPSVVGSTAATTTAVPSVATASPASFRMPSTSATKTHSKASFNFPMPRIKLQ